MVAALLEILVLVVGCAGRRQQHDAVFRAGGNGVVRGLGDRHVHRTAALVGTSPPRVAANAVCRCTDEIGFGDAREVGTQGLDAAILGLATQNDVDAVRPGGECLLGALGVRRLAVVDEHRGTQTTDLLHAVRKSRIGQHVRHDLVIPQTGKTEGPVSRAGILAVVTATQCCDTGQIRNRLVMEKDGRTREDDIGRVACRGGKDVLAGRAVLLRDGPSPVVVYDDGGFVGAGNQALLDTGVVLQSCRGGRGDPA